MLPLKLSVEKSSFVVFFSMEFFFPHSSVQCLPIFLFVFSFFMASFTMFIAVLCSASHLIFRWESIVIRIHSRVDTNELGLFTLIGVVVCMCHIAWEYLCGDCVWLEVFFLCWLLYYTDPIPKIPNSFNVPIWVLVWTLNVSHKNVVCVCRFFSFINKESSSKG